ncbi:MAG: carboxylating nicotinate-nucleotide diphosphorylase [Candidatus Ratteibacteria bacterium]|nr:carboxylating nicotinate-nucleotide diphosphorylase [Candidatus Ratteibacteria bacterium]
MNYQKLRCVVELALKEDVGKEDLTTEAFIDSAEVKAAIISKGEGIISGLDIAAVAFGLVSKNIKFHKLVKDGDKIRRNQVLAILEGKAKKILTAERTALNFLSHLSGISTLTSKYAKQAGPYGCKILDTRKTIPLLREMEKYAVKMGGGHNHRMGLYDMVLIKGNHLKLIREKEIKELIESVKRKLSQSTKIEIEVETLDELKNVYDCKADIIMLDNMATAELRKAVKWTKQQKKSKKPLLEASGNINLSNIKEVAKTGVDFISVGEITHSAPALDMSLEIIKFNKYKNNR